MGALRAAESVGVRPGQLIAPPCYAVIFTSQRNENEAGYDEMAERMLVLAAEQPGFLGARSVRDPTGLGITVSYWHSKEAIAQWRRQAEHRAARDKGRSDWYSAYTLEIVQVERAYAWQRADGVEDPQP